MPTLVKSKFNKIISVSKILKSKYKVSRRLNTSIWGDAKDAFSKRSYRPGQHCTAKQRLSDYGIHLKEKQKIKAHYGRITEKQLKHIFKVAKKSTGNTGENFIALLERRLDMVVYRLNLAPTIFASRQLVSHKHIEVNGKSVNIPSFRVKDGDIVSVKSSSKNINLSNEAISNMTRPVPAYIELDAHNKKGKFINSPANIADVPLPFEANLQLIVEYYSR